MASPISVNLQPKGESWAGVVSVLLVVGLVGFALYFIVEQFQGLLQNTGISSATNALSGAVQSASNAATSVLNAANNIVQPIGTAASELSGGDQSGTSFWSGVNNFFTTGSIYGNQGSD